jgi:purine-binding chemotaxis protein CheW
MATDAGDSAGLGADKRWLLCRIGPRLCALPLENVVEITRLLPIEPLARAPPFVLGLSLLRGAPVPVVHAGLLFGDGSIQPERLVAIRAGSRIVAVAFSTVIGLRSIGIDAAKALPPLLQEAARDIITAISTHDAELLHVLDAARMVSDSMLESAIVQGASL